jgi:hypothetical protein
MKYLSESKGQEKVKTYTIVAHLDVFALTQPTGGFWSLVTDEHMAKRTKRQKRVRNVTDLAAKKLE